MYTPNHYKFSNNQEMIAFMKRYSFATIVTNIDQKPVATQLPFVIKDNGDRLSLSSHFARANEQALYIDKQQSLIIFSEPHAYISPAHYDKKDSVPTWDYMAVHAYGIATTIEDEAGKLKLLEQMIGFYEPAYQGQWNELPDKFKNGMLKGIVAFELEVTELQGQKKLSQNKTAAERQRIIEQLQHSDSGVARDIAAYIREVDS
ncbi:FMN-binding negative transcriptional regulator [Niabella yanshanensis]|uniref:FMN-binding negative transcriptional regulator n=1 Tax=Niabella yanshanensis TaxID=577386 RepID=A0ABZ0WAB3_9BACT|nr:FMN-binding negative transcriptional regulator [Niabella yanshanensis]WQD39011.1 FMN-binding negative transcriptional regulator [Niabella yanshanensis]